MIEIVTIETPSLGDRSYVATDGDVAIVVDPQRDVDRVIDVLAERGVTVTHVLETHVHNDYVTGGWALADRLGATYVLQADERMAVPFHGVRDGDVLTTGGLTVEAVATPGHTPTHLSYVLRDAEGRAVAVFTGGSMLFGSVGRPDLIDEALTRELAEAQFRSVRRLADELPDDAEVHPTHGFGSHCSATQAAKRSSTIGEERADNPALVTDDVETFVRELLAGLTPYPTYYAQMGALNRLGPTGFEPASPAALDLDAVIGVLEDGGWVLDLRSRQAFCRSHLRGTVNVEVRNDLPENVGWVVPFDVDLVLVADDPRDIAEAQRMLARIGYDRLAGEARYGELGVDGHARHGSYHRANFAALAEVPADERVVLDVRDAWEWDSGHHPDAVHIPFHELDERADELPLDRQVWIYCATGARATVAASLLAARGYDPVLVDDFCLPGDVPGVVPAEVGG